MSKLMKESSTPERIKQALAEAKLKPVDLARMTGINKGSISNYIAGRYEPKSIAINKMASALGVSEMWLWGYDVPKGRSDIQIKNDLLVQAITKMRSDSEFADMVLKLSKINAEQRDIINRLLSTFTNNQSID